MASSSSPRNRASNITGVPAHWEHFEHDADIGVRGVGGDPATAFEQAAIAMTAVIADPADVRPLHRVRFDCSAPDLELLLVDFLNGVVFEMATRKMLFSRFDVGIEDATLRATAYGEAVDVGRHQPAAEIKGATLTALDVHGREDGTWVAQCVVDV